MGKKFPEIRSYWIVLKNVRIEIGPVLGIDVWKGATSKPNVRKSLSPRWGLNRLWGKMELRDDKAECSAETLIYCVILIKQEYEL